MLYKDYTVAMSNKGNKGKTISFMFVLIVAGLIIYLTLQSSQETLALSDWVEAAVNRFYELNGWDITMSWWYPHFSIRSLAHVPEYFLLGLSVSLFVAMLRSKCDSLADFAFIAVMSILMCGLFSLGDEILKYCLPTREFSATDMLLDLCGYGAGTAINLLFLPHLLRKRKCDGKN